MEVREISKQPKRTLPPEKMEALVKKKRAEDEKMVKGMFEFTDAGGGWLDFAYRIYKGAPIQMIKIFHGEICDLPMGIVRHLNNTFKKIRTLGNGQNLAVAGAPSGAVIPGGMGAKVPMSYIKTSRCRFTQVDLL